MRTSILFVSLLLFTSCAVIQPGEVGVKNKLGKLGKIHYEGVIFYNPFVTQVMKVSVRTINRELNISLPSKEGLTIESDISILYRIQPEKARDVITTIGGYREYDKIITSVFRSSAADVCARFYAKDMHSGERDNIEKSIRKRMNEKLEDKGFIIEEVLMKSISLPPGLSKAIEDKLEAEQQTQRMEFVLSREIKEAERKLIEAEGDKEAQLILAEGLTETILRLREIEVLKEIAKSNNSKVIITDGRGKNPVMINTQQ